MSIESVNSSHNLNDRPLKGSGNISRAKEVAQQFEAMFAQIMLKSMRNTVGNGGLIPESFGEELYTDMLDQEYAKLISKQGSLGLSDLLLKELNKGEEDLSNNPLSDLNNIESWMFNKKLLPSGNTPSVTGTSSNSLIPWENFIKEAAEKYDIDSSLIKAVIVQESGGNPYAVSRAGAKGLMQLMDPTAREMGVGNSFNPMQNIHGGTKYLSKMLSLFNGDKELALASYNAGPNAVERYNGIPPYKETENYVKKVLNLEEQFNNIEGEKENE